MEEKMDLRKIFGILKHYAGLVLLLGVAGAIVAGVISYSFLTPKYETSTQLLISQEAGSSKELTERNIEADLQLVNTYSGLIKSPVILEKVSERLALMATADELKEQVSVESAMDSQLVGISVTDTSQRRAVEIANMTAAVFQEEVKNILNVDNVKILSPAVVKADLPPSSPEPVFNIAIGAAVGLMLGVGAAFLLVYMDTSIKDEEDVRTVLGLPVLAEISPIDGPARDGRKAKVALKQKEA